MIVQTSGGIALRECGVVSNALSRLILRDAACRPLLSMRTNGMKLDPHGEEAPTGPREARPDDRLRAVSNHEARLPTWKFRQKYLNCAGQQDTDLL
jgi:hypothetical protein